MVSGLKHVVGVAYDGISDRVYWTDVRSVCLIARDYLTNVSSCYVLGINGLLFGSYRFNNSIRLQVWSRRVCFGYKVNWASIRSTSLLGFTGLM